MIEITVSKARKIAGQPYENTDIYCSLKSQCGDEQAETELVRLNGLATEFVDTQAQKIKEKQ